MSEYFFVKQCVDVPMYSFPDEYCDAIPLTFFTYPSEAIPLIVRYLPEGEYEVPDAIDLPNFAIKKEIFTSLNISNVYGVNWIDIKLHDKGIHDYVMLQVANKMKVIDRESSKFKKYRKDDDGDEFISGIQDLKLNNKLIISTPIEERLILIDKGWYKRVFFHKSIVSTIEASGLFGIKFIPADGYSDFK